MSEATDVAGSDIEPTSFSIYIFIHLNFRILPFATESILTDKTSRAHSVFPIILSDAQLFRMLLVFNVSSIFYVLRSLNSSDGLNWSFSELPLNCVCWLYSQYQNLVSFIISYLKIIGMTSENICKMCL